MNGTVPTRNPDPLEFEAIACLCCGSWAYQPFLVAQDDLTGKPGTFRFVTCTTCGLVYQNPRLTVGNIKPYYDDDYLAHRKRTDWGLMTGSYERAMDKLDCRKAAIVRRHLTLDATHKVLDLGCGAGTFLLKMRALYGATVVGVDFKDLSAHPWFEQIEFHCGLACEQDLGADRFDLVTMWHFLEHDYDPRRTLCAARRAAKPGGYVMIEVPRLDSATFRLFRDRWPGLQAPQHTVLFSKETLLRFVRETRLDVVEYLPYGAFPAYWYLFTGVAFTFLKGKGLDVSTAIYPYFLGQLAVGPVLLLEKQLNLAMQTVVCRRAS